MEILCQTMAKLPLFFIITLGHSNTYEMNKHKEIQSFEWAAGGGGEQCVGVSLLQLWNFTKMDFKTEWLLFILPINGVQIHVL